MSRIAIEYLILNLIPFDTQNMNEIWACSISKVVSSIDWMSFSLEMQFFSPWLMEHIDYIDFLVWFHEMSHINLTWLLSHHFLKINHFQAKFPKGGIDFPFCDETWIDISIWFTKFNSHIWPKSTFVNRYVIYKVGKHDAFCLKIY